MCGRYTLRVSAERMRSLFTLPELPPEFTPRFNIAPTQAVPVVGLKRDGRTRGLLQVRWGLVPGWANDPADVGNTFNARAEGIENSPSFREAFRGKRCLIPMDGFFEWQKGAGKKGVPHHIRFPDDRPFAVAGLWERWGDGVTG